MAKVLGRIVAPNGKYIQEGVEKTRWLRCGTLLETDNGMRIKLDSMPIGVDFDGWFSVFEEDDKPKPQTRAVPETETTEPF